MILDSLEHTEKYTSLHKGLEAGFRFLRQPDVTELPAGTYEIDGDRIFAIVDHATSRRAEEGQLEGHRRYIDIQYIISGEESIGWSPTTDLTISVDYDPKKDLQFFEEKADSIILIPPGTYAIFFPEDAHLPLIGSGPIHKVIIKVAI